MYHIIAGLSFLGTFRPYLRKHITQNINPWEFMFMNSIVIGLVTGLYCYFHKKENPVNLLNLAPSQYLSVLIIACITVLGSLFYFSIEKDNVVSTSFLWRGVSSVIFVGTGLFLFEEKLTVTQLMGILITIVGSFLVAKEGGGTD
jgi:drug/metabolite transporter (DMT)-like permease